MTMLEGISEKHPTAEEYIRTSFEPSDRIAILVRNRKRGGTIQRITTVEKVVGPSFQDWMRYKNDNDGCDIYVGMNALKPQAQTRTKEDILAIRHLYVDLDQDGSTSLAAIEKSDLVPPPSCVLNTSPDKYQVIWRVEEVQQSQAQALLHALAREFNGDRAATDSTRVLRIPGFVNKKYEQEFLVTIHSLTDGIYRLRDFKLRTEAVDSDHRRPHGTTRTAKTSERRPISQSERDWAHVKSSLSNGADPETLIAELARSRSKDKSDPQYYARLTVEKARRELQVEAGITQVRGT